MENGTNILGEDEQRKLFPSVYRLAYLQTWSAPGAAAAAKRAMLAAKKKHGNGTGAANPPVPSCAFLRARTAAARRLRQQEPSFAGADIFRAGSGMCVCGGREAKYYSEDYFIFILQ